MRLTTGTRMAFVLAALAIALAAPGRLLAVDGVPDPTFGTNGVMEIAWNLGGNNDDVAKGIAADRDGNLFVVGFGSSQTSDKDWEIAKIDPAGGILWLQRYFDLGGTNDDLAEALVLDDNGGLVVAGIADNSGSNDLEVCRFLTSTLNYDPAFGTAFGCEDVNFGAGQIFNVVALAQAGDGGFIVAGTINQSGDRNFFAARYTASGHLDPNFGFFGVRVIPWDVVPGGYDVLHAMAVDLSGSILLGGSAEGGTIYTIAVLAKLSAAGNLDLGFGSGGKVMLPSDSQYPSSWESAVELDLRAGTSFGVANYLGATDGTSIGWTYLVDSAGTLSVQQSFVYWDLAAQNFPVRVLFQGDGYPLVVGYHTSGSGAIFDASRSSCLDGCLPDPFWGNSGSASFSPSAAGYGQGVEVAAATLSRGRPVLVGSTQHPDLNWLVLRFTNGLIFADGFETGDVRVWSAAL